jgi:hypothetical protein
MRARSFLGDSRDRGSSRPAEDDERVDSAVVGGLFGLGGVTLGVALNYVVGKRARAETRADQREQARQARELVAAEHLDEALVCASEALDRGRDVPLEDRYVKARRAWEDGWVNFSPRVHEQRVLDRYEAVGSILAEVVIGDRTVKEVPRHVAARAIVSARATLGYFLRGEELPPAAFPEPSELRKLLGRGDGTDDPMGPLREWLTATPLPEFHAGGLESADES